MSNIGNDYFEWMYESIYNPEYTGDSSYRELLSFLHSIPFQYILPLDSDRGSDGENLRYQFGYAYNIRESVIAAVLDNKPCSVLEMMIALSQRIETHIMDDPDIGDRTSKWFWGMIESLGLSDMSDGIFNQVIVDDVVQRFLDREYSYNGDGGLFTIDEPYRDMRDVEIWYQAMWYLNEER